MSTYSRRPKPCSAICALWLVMGVMACTDTQATSDNVVPVQAKRADLKQFDELKQQVEKARALDAAGVRKAFPSTRTVNQTLGYDAATSEGLQIIQDSTLALPDEEFAVLTEQGLVLSSHHQFPTFLLGYAAIYAEHLPLFVSADSIMEALHSSYDTILSEMELFLLIDDLQQLLKAMRNNLPKADWDADSLANADLYLGVAQGLLDAQAPEPIAGASASQLTELINAASSAMGISTVTLFGEPRMVDFSQFTPRGHYASDPKLQAYFQAMMWLGRVDLRIIESLSDGSTAFRRPQYETMLLLHSLMEKPEGERWERIDTTIRTFVGESDYMVVPEVAALIADLGGLRAARDADDTKVVQAIVDGGYGKQQIASHLMVNDGTVKTLPLNRSFLLFGQRYVVDSHVFSEVVYDRVGSRLMPDPLDAAFAALGNNDALALLDDQLQKYDDYPGALAGMRTLIDAHDTSFWDENFYNLWMSALRSLSPNATDADPASVGLPAITATDAWGRRMLNTQLGSWAELRHDTLLYAKQSYTGIPSCEFPDAYVEPYPAFFDAIGKYATAGGRIADIAVQSSNADFSTRVADYFSRLGEVASILKEMAEYQRQGTPFTDGHMAFINEAVRVDQEAAGCVTVDVPNGWYADLFFTRDKSIEFDPTIADVHTQPADEGGNIVGRILHVGTGFPRMMITTIDTCTGPRAYAGMAYSYHEEITKDFDRLTDERWQQQLQDAQAAPPAEAPWLAPILIQ